MGARRKQILEAKERLGGVKSKPRKRWLTRTIVAPVSRVFSPTIVQADRMQSELFRNFEVTLKKYDFRLHLSVFDPADMLEEFATAVRTGSCDGLLLLSGICNEAVADLLRTQDFPHVSPDFYAERFHANTVRAHTSEGLRQAAEHLVADGIGRVVDDGETDRSALGVGEG